MTVANEKVSTEVDVTQFLIGYDGKALSDPKLDGEGTPVVGEDGKPETVPVSFRVIATIALEQVGRMEADRSLPPAEKLRAYQLAHRIALQDKVAFKSEDITFLENRIGMTFPMNVVGATAMILNPAQLTE